MAFAYGSQIKTDNGLKNIEDVKIGDVLFTPYGVELAFASNEFQGEVLVITTDKGKLLCHDDRTRVFRSLCGCGLCTCGPKISAVAFTEELEVGDYLLHYNEETRRYVPAKILSLNRSQEDVKLWSIGVNGTQFLCNNFLVHH